MSDKDFNRYKFSSNLKNARENSGYTRSELADKLGVSKNTVTAYEINQNYPTFITLVRLIELLEVDASELLFGNVKKKDTSKI